MGLRLLNCCAGEREGLEEKGVPASKAEELFSPQNKLQRITKKKACVQAQKHPAVNCERHTARAVCRATACTLHAGLQTCAKTAICIQEYGTLKAGGAKMEELRTIPNVGVQTEKDLRAMGYTTIESLKGKSGEELYAQECRLRGCAIDRCQLYLLRAVSYFVNTEHPDATKCKWWLWKDEFVLPSPCGAVCAECARFPAECAGCRKIKGRVFWTQFVNRSCCAVYDCCVNDKGMETCAGCKALPCERFTKDPTLSDAQNEAALRTLLANLARLSHEPDEL